MITAHKIHSGKYTVVFNSEDHTYSINGQQKESATGVVDIMDKPALVRWAANQARDYFKANVKPGVPLDEVEIERLAKAAAVAHTDNRDTAASLGTLVHTWIHKWIMHHHFGEGPNPSYPTNAEARLCVEGFLAFDKKFDPEYLWSERIVYHPGIDIAGTADVGMRIRGVSNQPILGDWKTSKGVWPGYALQTEYYRRAVISEEKGWTKSTRALIHLTKDGSFDFYDEVDLFSMTGNDQKGDWAAFQGLVEAQRWKAKNPSRWRGRKGSRR